MWTRFSACAFIVRLLSYHPLCLYSYSKLFHAARGKACVVPVFLMHFQYPLAFLCLPCLYSCSVCLPCY